MQHKEKAGLKIEFNAGAENLKAAVDAKEFQRIISNLVNNSIILYKPAFTIKEQKNSPWPPLAYKLLCTWHSGTKSKRLGDKDIMKKTSILIAMFAVIAAASLVKAGGFDVDFDKGAFRAVDFMEAVKTSGVSRTDDAASITPVPATAVNTVNMAVYTLTIPNLQKLRKEVVNMPGLSEEFLQQINKENTVVLYNEDSVFLTTQVGAIQHIILESNDKKLMEFISKQKAGALQANLQQKMTCWNVIKILWKVVNGISIAYEVMTEVCNTPGTPGGSGSTWNSGQGGNSNYDVNKHQK